MRKLMKRVGTLINPEYEIDLSNLIVSDGLNKYYINI
jgi:hypothetical protein